MSKRSIIGVIVGAIITALAICIGVAINQNALPEAEGPEESE